MTNDLFDENENIHINRGDRLLFEYSIDNDGTDYIFQEGDYITFGIYGEKGMDESPFVFEKFIPEVGSTSVDIDIPSEKMRIGDYINKPKDYWYEIQLNNEITTHGFKKEGAKVLTLYPEGMIPDVNS